MQWDPSALQPNRRTDIPRYIKRHMCLSHLHTNHLRLVMRHRALVTLSCSRKMAEESVWIAASTIDAVDAYRSANQHAHMFRLSAAMFLTAAIIPLICVIVQENKSGGTSTSTTTPISTPSNNRISASARDEATRAFNKALGILREIAPGFGIAALMLHRLSAAIEVASQVIEKRKSEKDNSLNPFPVNSADGISDLQMDDSQNLLDLFKDFEKPYDEISANQEMLFWGGGGTGVGGEAYEMDLSNPGGGGVADMFAADLNCQFDWSLSMPIV